MHSKLAQDVVAALQPRGRGARGHWSISVEALSARELDAATVLRKGTNSTSLSGFPAFCLVELEGSAKGQAYKEPWRPCMRPTLLHSTPSYGSLRLCGRAFWPPSPRARPPLPRPQCHRAAHCRGPRGVPASSSMASRNLWRAPTPVTPISTLRQTRPNCRFGWRIVSKSSDLSLRTTNPLFAVCTARC